MKVTSKRFVITSEVKNSNGFRVRTSGINLVDFNNNPLLLWMHQRPEGKRKDEVLPLGNVVDIKLEGTKYTGKLAFDETDEFAMSLYEKAENGTLRMVSAGLIPLTWSEDKNGDVWLETSTLKEVSLVDIGSNAEALAVRLYQEEKNKLITLSYDELLKTNLKPVFNMKIIELKAPEVLPLLKLADEATPADVQEAIGKLVKLAAKSKTQATEIITLTESRDDYKKQLETLQKEAKDAEIIALVDEAIDRKKILAGEKDKYIKLANADFDTTKSLLDGMKGQKSVKEQIEGVDGLEEDLTKLSWKQLEEKNLLVMLKEKDLPLFKTKFKAQFGVDYKG